MRTFWGIVRRGLQRFPVIWWTLFFLLAVLSTTLPALAQAEKAVSFTQPYTVLDTSVTIAASAKHTYFVSGFPVGKSWVLSTTNSGSTDPGAASLTVQAYQTNANVANYSQNAGAFSGVWDIWNGSQLNETHAGLANGNAQVPMPCSNGLDPKTGTTAECLGGPSSGEYLAFVIKNWSATTAVTLNVSLAQSEPNTELFASWTEAAAGINLWANGVQLLSQMFACNVATQDTFTATAGQTATVYTGNSANGWGYVCGATISTSGASTVTLEQGSGTTCGTGTTPLVTLQSLAGSYDWTLPGQTEILAFPLGEICIKSSAAVTVSVTVYTSQ